MNETAMPVLGYEDGTQKCPLCGSQNEQHLYFCLNLIKPELQAVDLTPPWTIDLLTSAGQGALSLEALPLLVVRSQQWVLIRSISRILS